MFPIGGAGVELLAAAVRLVAAIGSCSVVLVGVAGAVDRATGLGVDATVEAVVLDDAAVDDAAVVATAPAELDVSVFPPLELPNVVRLSTGGPEPSSIAWLSMAVGASARDSAFLDSIESAMACSVGEKNGRALGIDVSGITADSSDGVPTERPRSSLALLLAEPIAA